jgi:hypothetical protein
VLVDTVAARSGRSTRIVLASSNYPADINAAHGLRIDAYLVAGTFGEWVAMVDTLNVYWLKGRWF